MRILVTPPQLSRDLIELTEFKEALSRDESISGVRVVGDVITDIRVKALSISDSELVKIAAVGAGLEKLDISNVLLGRCDLSAANCADSSWRRVLLENVRCSGIKLQTSVLRDITFEDCKLNLTNFRFSKLKSVCFKGCDLDEADFYMAELNSVKFENCAFNGTVFSSAKCKSVDLRSSSLVGAIGIDGLAGATIDSVQLTTIAPILARHIKILVNDIQD